MKRSKQSEIFCKYFRDLKEGTSVWPTSVNKSDKRSSTVRPGITTRGDPVERRYATCKIGGGAGHGTRGDDSEGDTEATRTRPRSVMTTESRCRVVVWDHGEMVDEDPIWLTSNLGSLGHWEWNNIHNEGIQSKLVSRHLLGEPSNRTWGLKTSLSIELLVNINESKRRSVTKSVRRRHDKVLTLPLWGRRPETTRKDTDLVRGGSKSEPDVGVDKVQKRVSSRSTQRSDW